MKVNHNELKYLIKNAYYTKTPLMVTGGIGIGKSDQTRAAARELAQEEKLEYTDDNHYDDETRFHLIDIRVSQLDPVDLRGLPHYDEETKTTRWYYPSWLPTKGKGVIFFDEVNLATPFMQSSLYQLILDRRIGDYKLPKGYIIIAAGNRLEDKANVFDLPAPLANRFTHCELEPPKVDPDWTNWALENEIDPTIISFLNWRKDYLYKPSTTGKENAFPSPRTWMTANRISKNAKDQKDNYMWKILMASAIGEGVATEFMAFVALQQNFDLKRFFANPEGYPFPQKVDERYAMMAALAAHTKEQPKTLDDVLRFSFRIPPEYGLVLARSCKSLFGHEKFVVHISPKIKTQFSELFSKYLGVEHVIKK